MDVMLDMVMHAWCEQRAADAAAVIAAFRAADTAGRGVQSAAGENTNSANFTILVAFAVPLYALHRSEWRSDDDLDIRIQMNESASKVASSSVALE